MLGCPLQLWAGALAPVVLDDPSSDAPDEYVEAVVDRQACCEVVSCIVLGHERGHAQLQGCGYPMQSMPVLARVMNDARGC